MANPYQPSIGIVTPTYRRERLLRRFLHRLSRQSYPNWRSIIVHDGPHAESAALVARHDVGEGRIAFMATALRGNDVGVTPRHAGASYFAALPEPPDYCVFWDDDNYFYSGALQGIADAVIAANQPDLLLVGMEYRGRVLPPAEVSVEELAPGHVECGSLVMRPPVAVATYADLLRRKAVSPELNLYTQDYMAFNFIRSLKPAPRIHIARDVLVGFHDGLRWKPYLRRLLGIPQLGLANRAWFQTLTLGMVKAR